MERLKDAYTNYVILCELIKEEVAAKEKLYKKICNSTAGNFYLSLTDKQKETYLEIHPNDNISRYKNIISRLKDLEIKKDHVLEAALYVKDFPFNPNNRFNIFVMDGIDTYNALTEESTENINMGILFKSFIQDVIRKNYYVDTAYTKDDIPLIKVSVEEFKKKKTSLNELEYTISCKIFKIHKDEENNVTFKSNYLNIEEMKRNLIKDREIIDSSGTRFKNLLDEEIETVNYELELLDGKSIKALYCKISKIKDNALRENHLNALTKAYYNLSNIDFRYESDYFANKTDSMHANFSTSIKEINEKILAMKKR